MRQLDSLGTRREDSIDGRDAFAPQWTAARGAATPAYFVAGGCCKYLGVVWMLEASGNPADTPGDTASWFRVMMGDYRFKLDLITDAVMSGAGVASGTDQLATLQTQLDDAAADGYTSAYFRGDILVDGVLNIPNELTLNASRGSLILADDASQVRTFSRSSLEFIEIAAQRAFTGTAVQVRSFGATGAINHSAIFGPEVIVSRDYVGGHTLDGVGVELVADTSPVTFNEIDAYVKGFKQGYIINSLNSFANNNIIKGRMYNCEDFVTIQSQNGNITSQNKAFLQVQCNSTQGTARRVVVCDGQRNKFFITVQDWAVADPVAFEMDGAARFNEVWSQQADKNADAGTANKFFMETDSESGPTYRTGMPLSASQTVASSGENHLVGADQNPDMNVVITGDPITTPGNGSPNRIFTPGQNLFCTIANCTETRINIDLGYRPAGLYMAGAMFNATSLPDEVEFYTSDDATAFGDPDAMAWTLIDRTRAGTQRFLLSDMGIFSGNFRKVRLVIRNTVAKNVSIEQLFAAFRKVSTPPILDAVLLGELLMKSDSWKMLDTSGAVRTLTLGTDGNITAS